MAVTYHTTILASNMVKSKKFYDTLFQLLGWNKIFDDKNVAAYSDNHFSVWIFPAKDKEPLRSYDAPGVDHLGFHVKSKELVDKVYKGLKKNKVKIDIEPKKYPEYSETYYSVFFFDPDNTRFEVVFS